MAKPSFPALDEHGTHKPQGRRRSMPPMQRAAAIACWARVGSRPAPWRGGSGPGLSGSALRFFALFGLWGMGWIVAKFVRGDPLAQGGITLLLMALYAPGRRQRDHSAPQALADRGQHGGAL